nr:Ty3/gypsy retrotransposon protein [Tanacetum cinerariifolium]
MGGYGDGEAATEVRVMMVTVQTKYSKKVPGGLLQPFLSPSQVWEEVSMDFIIGLPAYKSLSVTFVVVDRFTKYVHFEPLPTSFNAPKYLRAMVSEQPHHSMCLLPWAEYSYNTSFYSSIKMMPYQVVYGRVPPTIIPYLLGSSKVATVEETLIERDSLLRQLRQNLLVTKHRMEMKANRKRQDVEFNIEDMALVKLQLYHQVTLAKRHSNKLAKRYYVPFKVLKRVGKVAYRLALPDFSKIHPVFHVLLLKSFLGTYEVQVTALPEEDHEGLPVEQPLAICDNRIMLQKGIPACQVLV